VARVDAAPLAQELADGVRPLVPGDGAADVADAVPLPADDRLDARLVHRGPVGDLVEHLPERDQLARLEGDEVHPVVEGPEHVSGEARERARVVHRHGAAGGHPDLGVRERRDDLLDDVGSGDQVGAAEDQHVLPGVGEEQVDRGGLPLACGLDEHADPGVARLPAPGDRHRRVGAAARDDDDLGENHPARSLREDRLEQPADVGLLVVGGDSERASDRSPVFPVVHARLPAHCAAVGLARP